MKASKLLAFSILLIILTIAAYFYYMSENIAGVNENKIALEINKVFNELLAKEFSSSECKEIKSRYEVTKEKVYLNVHGWKSSCNKERIKALANTSRNQISTQDMKIEIKFFEN